MNNNILITSAGKRVALVRYFKETLLRFFPEAKVFITEMNPSLAPASYVCDKSFVVPRVTAPGYSDILLTICEDNHIGMVIPTIDTELLILAEHKSDFEKRGIHLVVSDKSFVSMCRDKRKTGDLFKYYGINVPKAVDKCHPSFPFFAKPFDGSLSTNLHIIRTESELTPNILNDEKLLFMELIDKNEFQEYTVDMYYGKDNRVKCIIPRERIEIRAGEINKGRTAKNEIVGFLKDKLEHIDGSVGCICVQLFFNSKTKNVLGIEINPRFGGGYPLSYSAGGNYPEMLIREYFLGEKVEYFQNWKDGMLMLRYDDAIFV